MHGPRSQDEILENALGALQSGGEREAVLAALAEQAARCLRLAHATHDREAARMLAAMAADYERTVAVLGAANDR